MSGTGVSAGRSWQQVAFRLVGVLRGMRHGEFVIIDYQVGMDPDPYVQAAPEADGGWYCEVASGFYLPADQWPIDTGWLRAAGWLEDPEDNWWQDVGTPSEATANLLAGLRRGRRCQDPSRLIWRVDRFGDGPRGGLPIVPSQPSVFAA